MNYGVIETEIVDRLKGHLKSKHIDIQVLPENESQLNRAATKPLITVAYLGSDFSKPLSVECATQDEDMRFMIVVKTKSLRSQANTTVGAYELIDLVQKSLLGYRPENLSKAIHFISNTLAEREQNQWTYELTVSCRGVLTAFEEDEILPLLQQVNLNETFE